ncbi:Os08g0265000, partial [Oryza sativa Japonica Group]
FPPCAFSVPPSAPPSLSLLTPTRRPSFPNLIAKPNLPSLPAARRRPPLRISPSHSAAARAPHFLNRRTAR